MTRRKDGLTCTATAKSTENRCGNPPIPGGKVCKFHGGAAPQVKAAGALRVMEAMVGPVLVEMARVIQDPTVSDTVKMTTCRDILDRTGYKPVQQLEVLTIGMVEAEIARLEAELAG